MGDFWIQSTRIAFADGESPGAIFVSEGRIRKIYRGGSTPNEAPIVHDLGNLLISPGFVDLHVHGGGGADFMDGTTDAFLTACRAHARHGTTSLLATTTAASARDIFRMLQAASGLVDKDTGGARIAGVHLYGPHFHSPAKGCHPDPEQFTPKQLGKLLEYSPILTAATIAPEHPEAQAFAKECVAEGIRLHMGHSHCTFAQAEAAVVWGVRHVDHLFCAMSDRARLRLEQAWPMRGGLFEATLCLDELTTEVIADGCHLSPELLRLAWKIKGPDQLALVTDSMRGLDQPAGEYIFGPKESGIRVISNGRVGLMPDGKALASAIQGMDEGVRRMIAATGEPPWRILRAASLVPARIAGLDGDIGSIELDKRADLLCLDDSFQPLRVWIGGKLVLGSC